MSRADVMLWGTHVGAVALDGDEVAATFQYTPELVAMGVELSPLTMPVREAPYRFPGLAADTFHGLPGLLADSLPDRFGNAIIAAWLRGQGRSPADFDPVELDATFPATKLRWLLDHVEAADDGGLA